MFHVETSNACPTSIPVESLIYTLFNGSIPPLELLELLEMIPPLELLELLEMIPPLELLELLEMIPPLELLELLEMIPPLELLELLEVIPPLELLDDVLFDNRPNRAKELEFPFDFSLHPEKAKTHAKAKINKQFFI